MGTAGMVRAGLGLLALGNAWWTFTNGAYGLVANAATDVVIALGCAIALLSLGRALDGLGPGPWRAGLLLVALAHLAQNAYNAASLDFPDGVTVLVVLAASLLLALGALLWSDDGWNGRAAVWLGAGMAGVAFEPLYYTLRYAWADPWQSGYGPGGLLVLAGAGLAAWAFLLGDGPPAPAPIVPPARPAKPAKPAERKART